jgi:transcriptional regulator with XRE-family HTH domain
MTDVVGLDSVLQPVAVNVGRHRRRRGLSLSALAGAAGISKSTLSELERGRGNPSLDTLWALANALNVPLSALFLDADDPGVRVQRLSSAKVVTEEDGMVTQHLLSLHGRGEVEMYVVALADGATRWSPAHGPGQIEHIVVLSGRADVGLDGDSVVLEQGDAISFPCDRPHHYLPVDGPARLLVLQDYP